MKRYLLSLKTWRGLTADWPEIVRRFEFWHAALNRVEL